MRTEILMSGTDSSCATSEDISHGGLRITPSLTPASEAQGTSSAGWAPLESLAMRQETQALLLEDTKGRFYPEGPGWPNVGTSGRLALSDPLLEDEQPRLISSGNGDRGRAKLAVPRLEGLGTHDPILTDSVRKLLRVLWSIVVSRALQGSFPLHSTAVSIFEDPSEDERKALLRVVCHASAAQAIAFWDSLDPDLQGWLRRLNDRDRTTFVTTISLRVHWV